jgi:hypothetical protein
VKEESRGNELLLIPLYLLEKQGTLSRLDGIKEPLVRFLHTIQRSYFDIPYHNKTHAADLV